jgi:hypothetical protein
LAKNADLLVFNCAVLDPPGSPSQLYKLHTPPKKIGEAARESGVKRLLAEPPCARCRKPGRRGAEINSRVLCGAVGFASDKLRVSVGK